MRKTNENVTCKWRLLVAIFLVSATAYGQDIQFSQFYSSPLYLNPAFAGSAHHHRFIIHNRWQWPSLDAKYTTYSFTADSYFNRYRSGVGLIVTNDRQGSSSLSTTEIQGLYSYELHLNDKLTMRAGAQVGLLTRYIDLSDKKFTDQFTNQGFDANTPSGELFTNQRKNMLDLSFGSILYSQRLWVGLSAHHVNSPNQSFYGGVSQLPTKFSVVAGYKIPLIHTKHMAYLEDEKDISITPTAFYKFQGKSDQIDLGMYGQYDQLLVGFWYRGIPFKKYNDALHNNESMIFQVGWHFNSFSVAYSYDWVVSNLHAARPFGAHEINLTYILNKRHKGAKPMKKLPCPHFYKGQ